MITRLKNIPILLIVLIFCGTVDGFSQQTSGTIVDERDGQNYEWVRIGNQIWMAENMGYLPDINTVNEGSEKIDGKYYYVYGYNGTNVDEAKSTENYITYGALYNWYAAMNGASSSSSNPSEIQGICPEGWHIPSNAEWEELKNYMINKGYNDSVGYAIKSANGWSSNGNGIDVFGFTGLPGGYREFIERYSGQGVMTSWWSTTEQDANYAWLWYLASHFERFNKGWGDTKDYGHSVRCIKNPFPGLIISADSLDFGSSSNIVSDTSLFVYLKNIGTDSLIIDSINPADLPFNTEFEDLINSPDQVAPGDSVKLTITLFTDTVPGTYNDTVNIYTNDRDTNIVITAQINELPNNDTIAPEIISIYPDSGSVTSLTQQELRIAFSDSSAIDSSMLFLIINGHSFSVLSPALYIRRDTIVFDPTRIGYSYDEGINTIFLDSLTDTEGNHQSIQWDVVIDTLAPQAHHLVPSPDTLINGDLPSLSLTITDSLGTVNPFSLNISVNQQDYGYSHEAISFNVSNGLLVMDWDKADLTFGQMDTVQVVLTGTDLIDTGKPNALTRSWEFITFDDTLAPVIDKVVPDNNQITSLTQQKIQIYFQDISPVDSSQLTLLVNDTSFSASSRALTFYKDSILFEPAKAGFSYKQGVNTIQLDSLTDLMNNQISRHWKFYLDTVSPETRNPYPSYDTIINKHLPRLSLEVYDTTAGLNPISLKVRINQNYFSYSDPSVNYDKSSGLITFDLEETGLQINHMDTISVHISGYDSIDIGEPNNFYRQWNFTFLDDNKAPEIDTMIPSYGAITSLPDQKVRISFSDISPIDKKKLVLKVNGTPFHTSTKALSIIGDSIVFDPLIGGIKYLNDTNTILLDSLIDIGGNKTSRQWKFLLDTVSPSTEQPLPQPDSSISGSIPDLSLFILDSIGELDPHSLQVIINDDVFPYSHQATDFHTHNNQLTFNWGKVNINFDHMDTVQVQIKGYDQMDHGEANVFMRQWKFIIFNDFEPPEIITEIPKHDQIISNTNQKIKIRFTDRNPLDSISILLKINSTSFGLKSPNLSLAGDTIVFDPLMSDFAYKEGKNRIEINQLKDAIGNDTSLSWNFTLDTVMPRIESQLPPPGSLVYDCQPVLKVVVYDRIGKVDHNSLELQINGNTYSYSQGDISFNESDQLLTFACKETDLVLGNQEKVNVILSGKDVVDFGQPNAFEFHWNFTAITKGYLKASVIDAFGFPIPEATINIIGNESTSMLTNEEGIIITDLDIRTYDVIATKSSYFSLKKESIKVKKMDTTDIIFNLGVLGDYDVNGEVDYHDLDAFIHAYNEDSDSIEFAPVSGNAPNYMVHADGKLDFEDLMIFPMIWSHYTNENPVQTKISSLYNDNREMLRVQSNNSGQKANYTLKFNNVNNYRSAKVLISYNPEVLEFSCLMDGYNGSDGANDILLTRIDKKRGLIEVVHAIPGYYNVLTNEPLISLQFNQLETTNSPIFFYEIRDNLGNIYTRNIQPTLKENIQSPELICYPNPIVNGKAHIVFVIPKKGEVRIDLLENTGKTVNQLMFRHFPAGKNTLKCSLISYPAGTYFIRMQYKGYEIIRKCILTK